MSNQIQSLPVFHDLNIGRALAHMGKTVTAQLSGLVKAYRISEACEQEFNKTGQISPATMDAIRKGMETWA